MPGKAYMRSIRKTAIVIVIVAAILSLIVAILASPLALQHLAGQRFDWARLSNVGQSYGAASAILSTLAIIGVAFTLIVQARESKESRNYSIREMHTNLMRIGMTDGKLLEAWGDLRVPDELDRDVAIYANLIVNYLVSLYETRTASLEEIRRHVESIFDGATGREYWKANRDTWLVFYRGRSKKVADMIEAEYRRSVASGPPVRPLPTVRDSQKSRRSRRLLRPQLPSAGRWH
jgi:hypothetical protein